MRVYDNVNAVIGKTFQETSELDWSDLWPAVDTATGVIHAVLDSDRIPSGAILLDYDAGSDSFRPVDGNNGFDAVDYYSY